MLFAQIDKKILDNCVENAPHGWEDFVDRFTGLVLHVIDHTADTLQRHMPEQERDYLCEAVFAVLRRNDCRLLRNYQGKSTLSSYLTVVVRRIIIWNMTNKAAEAASA